MTGPAILVTLPDRAPFRATYRGPAGRGVCWVAPAPGEGSGPLPLLVPEGDVHLLPRSVADNAQREG